MICIYTYICIYILYVCIHIHIVDIVVEMIILHEVGLPIFINTRNGCAGLTQSCAL